MLNISLTSPSFRSSGHPVTTTVDESAGDTEAEIVFPCESGPRLHCPFPSVLVKSIGEKNVTGRGCFLARPLLW